MKKILVTVSLVWLACYGPDTRIRAQEGAEGGLGQVQPEVTEVYDPIPATTPPPKYLFPGSYPERLFDFIQFYKKEYHIPLSVGAWNWFHANTGGPLLSGYGIPPNQKGTYFWYIFADPEMAVDLGPISKVGYHAETRLREIDLFRTFFTSQVWTWENYGWFDTPIGRIKGGQIWKRFGLDWDGSFWGNVQYFDGFKLDPDLGLSWENTWTIRDNLTMPTFVQFFFHEDGINGTIAGSEPESLPGYNERSTGVFRAVPTWALQDGSILAVGLSGLVGRITSFNVFFEQVAIDEDETVFLPAQPVPDQVLSAWCVDVSYRNRNLLLFAEVLQAYGILNPVRYVSGGPSNRITNALVGFNYRLGPVTLRFVYSAGIDDNPFGWQSLYVPGVTLALTKNCDFYADYVRWDVFQHKDARHIEFEDGFQLVLNWRF